MRLDVRVGYLLVGLLLAATVSGCAIGGQGTSLGVREDFESTGAEGTYRLTATSFAGQVRVGPAPERVEDARPAEIEATATVNNEPGKLHLSFDAPESETPLVLELEGGETMSGTGVGLVSSERVLVALNAFKVGAGDVEIVVHFRYLE
jgi:hypothetical protein